MGRLSSRLVRSRVVQARVIIQNPAQLSRLPLISQNVKAESSDSTGARRKGPLSSWSSSSNDGNEPTGWAAGLQKFIEGCATAVGSILILGIAGYSYHVYYKEHVLRKMEGAFAVGYSSVELAALSRQIDPRSPHASALAAILQRDGDADDNDWVYRDEQAVIDSIVDGTTKGFYHLVSGEKGTGKTSMLLKAMRKIGGEGVAMMEAHGDPEIFRIRLGKALDFEFHEDYIGSLFSFKGPRDTTALLDIERAFNKMEKVALKRKEQVGKPLVLIITGVHFVRDDEDGQDLLELIQQRAELWAASGLVTVVFGSDDYWTMERLMWQATRLRVTSVRDIPRAAAMQALQKFRLKAFSEEVPDNILAEVYAKIGGRLSFLSRVAKSPDMIQACNAICDRERRWLLNKYWVLGKDLDPGGEDQQDLSSAAMLLAKALVDKEDAMKREGNHDGSLPQIPLHEARQIMTNAAWIKHHDHHNIFTINPDGMVQADSVSMQAAMRHICNMPGFQAHLQETLDRLDEIECLQRTREVTLKDLGEGGKYRIVLGKSARGETEATISLKATLEEETSGGESE